MNDIEYTKARIDSLVNQIMNKLDSNRSIDNRHELYSFEELFGDWLYSGEEFNFYPSSSRGGRCHKLAIFTSLTGKRWLLKPNCKKSFEQTFNQVIKHCQGLCPNYTNTVAIITDNWDDDISSFWQANINNIKATGVNFELRQITGSLVQASQI